MDTTPPVCEAPRRHHSRQREQLLAFLRATKSHPTAAQIHEALQPRMPALALATVYRNLEILVAEGRVAEVPATSGALRYDGNLEPHDHFGCDRCGRLIDVPARGSERFARRLAERHGLRARRVQISFIGTCPDCLASEVGEARNPSDRAGSRRRRASGRRGRSFSRSRHH